MEDPISYPCKIPGCENESEYLSSYLFDDYNITEWVREDPFERYTCGEHQINFEQYMRDKVNQKARKWYAQWLQQQNQFKNEPEV
jgi:hypothetical protein